MRHKTLDEIIKALQHIQQHQRAYSLGQLRSELEDLWQDLQRIADGLGL